VTVPLSTNDLYERGAATLLASWEAFAGGAQDAALRRAAGVASAVFPCEPERSILNNALLERGLPSAARRQAIEAMEAAYAEAGVERFAAWVHESDAPLRADFEARGYTLNEANRMMGMSLDEIRVPRPELEGLSREWQAHLDFLSNFGVPEGFLAGLEPGVYQAVNAGPLATGIAFEHDGDCGVFNIGTVPYARRRGLGTAITALLVHDAAERGCHTASLQSTAIAEHVYAAVGFRDLGLILEYVPGGVS
jgi:ribosomal protein S18 acetylase RimI-like enzyme